MAFDLDDEENKATRIANGASKENRDKNIDIEVEEYVRTRAGHFYKITRIDKNGLIYWNKIQCGWSMEQLKIKNYFDKRKNTNFNRFNYCPYCGKKIDWKELKERSK